MAIIYSYPQAVPKGSDLIIGTVTYDPNDPDPVRGNPTRSFRVSDLAGSIQGNSYTLTSNALGSASSIVLTDNTGFVSGIVNINGGTGVSSVNSGNSITISNTGVTSAAAGDGMSLSGSTGGITITNDGVTSLAVTDSTFLNLTLNAATGAITLGANLSATGTPTSTNFLRGDNTWAVPAGGGTVTSVSAGTDISITGTVDDPVINNDAPDQVVVLSGTGGIVITGTYPNFTVDGSAASGDITGGGTANTFTKWVSGTEIGNALLTEEEYDEGAHANVFPGEDDYVQANQIGLQKLSILGSLYDGAGSRGGLNDILYATQSGGVYWGPAPSFSGVTQIIAGDGISVSGTAQVTITNDYAVAGGTQGDVFISTGAATAWDDGDKYLKTTTTDISTFASIDDDITLGGGSASNTLLASQLAIKTYVDDNAGVTSLVAGANVVLTPASGLGDVTISTPDVIPYAETSTTNISFISTDNTLGGASSSDTVAPTQLAVKTYVDDNSGVTSIIAGTNISVTPVGGEGDVTINATNLVPYNEVSTAAMTFVDEDITLGGGSSSDTVLASQLAIKTYVDDSVSGGVVYQGGYNASTNTPDLTTSPNSILKGWMYTVTTDGTFYTETVRAGDVLISNIADPSSLSDWTTVQSNVDLATDGTSATAVRGIAGFDEDSFTVADGFVSLNTSSFNSTITDSAAITHGLGTRDVIVQLYDTVTFETLYADVVRTSTTQVTVNFGITPTNSVRVLITKAN